MMYQTQIKGSIHPQSSIGAMHQINRVMSMNQMMQPQIQHQGQHSVQQPIPQPMMQPTYPMESANRSMHQPMMQQIPQPMMQQIPQSMVHQIPQPMMQPTQQSMMQPPQQSMIQPIQSPIPQPMGQPTCPNEHQKRRHKQVLMLIEQKAVQILQENGFSPRLFDTDIAQRDLKYDSKSVLSIIIKERRKE